ncbi:MAG: hypothetical protein KKF48_00435 [Nanoarchaeota archaeon]|nr:hypothetical protein [Nanoarchaeota archaeon]MBU1027492.1 hypothetical protein [Nanoarchaeota archaeon]
MDINFYKGLRVFLSIAIRKVKFPFSRLELDIDIFEDRIYDTIQEALGDARALNYSQSYIGAVVNRTWDAIIYLKPDNSSDDKGILGIISFLEGGSIKYALEKDSK